MKKIQTPQHSPAPVEIGAGAAADTQTWWRSVREAEAPAQLEQWAKETFPELVNGAVDNVSRRRFVQLMGASFALGATACTKQPIEKLVPWVRQPEGWVPGTPQYFASALSLAGSAIGVLIESHDGRPIKVDGNPLHPSSRGGLDVRSQAAILGLYDPDRSQSVTHLGRISSWAAFTAALKPALSVQQAVGGEGLHIVTGALDSPTEKRMLAAIRERFPGFVHHHHEPAQGEAAASGLAGVFGQPVRPVYDFSKADVIVALDADFLVSEPGAVRAARDVMARRSPKPGESMSRLYCIESSATATAGSADHVVRLTGAGVERFALALAAALGVEGAAAPAGLDQAALEVVKAAAADLAAAGGAGCVVAGEYTSADLHALVAGINLKIGAMGTVVTVAPAPAAAAGGSASGIPALVEAISAGKVDVLLFLGTNPLFDAPAELGLGPALAAGKVKFSAHLGLYADETAAYAEWHVPAAHVFEAWGDAVALDGTASVVQPLILPLYEGKSTVEMLALVADRTDAASLDLVRETWAELLPGDAEWRQAVHDGVIAGTGTPVEAVADPAAVAAAAARLGSVGEGLELQFRPDPHLFDGRFANNGWLQECPRPLNKVSWDNPLLLSPKTAREQGVANGDMVKLTVAGRSLDVAVWVQPGQADGVATLYLGQGRRAAGNVGNGCGFDAYAIRPAASPWRIAGASIAKTGASYQLASTQEHHSMEGRHLVRQASLEQYHGQPDFAHHVGHKFPDITLYPRVAYEGYAWGMTIDLSACTGCNACVIACQSENNIPVVGKDQIARGREMHWIRIDRYYTGDPDDPTGTVHQPVPCMQCENAPCELVCPVAATVHSEEGLNDMVYNRCVGTRYCSNNCPYKVRRFNFYRYADYSTPVLKLLRNPDVTVRHRGVMEKCTYCTQRISGARAAAIRDDRRIADGEIKTACEQACPSGAIVFGDINTEGSRVAAAKADPRNYTLLDELNTKPRTSYLARVTNPNPTLPRAVEDHGGHH